MFHESLKKLVDEILFAPSPLSCLGFPCGSAGKESTCNVGDLGSIPGLGRSPGEGKGYPLQYSGLENSVGLWGCFVFVLGVVHALFTLNRISRIKDIVLKFKNGTLI